MRTFLIPPFFFGVYASALLMLTVLITPGVEKVSYSEVGCFLAGRMDLPPALRNAQSPASAGDFDDDIESF